MKLDEGEHTLRNYCEQQMFNKKIKLLLAHHTIADAKLIEKFSVYDAMRNDGDNMDVFHFPLRLLPFAIVGSRCESENETNIQARL